MKILQKKLKQDYSKKKLLRLFTTVEEKQYREQAIPPRPEKSYTKFDEARKKIQQQLAKIREEKGAELSREDGETQRKLRRGLVAMDDLYRKGKQKYSHILYLG
jgi:hypothetical protein